MLDVLGSARCSRTRLAPAQSRLPVVGPQSARAWSTSRAGCCLPPPKPWAPGRSRRTLPRSKARSMQGGTISNLFQYSASPNFLPQELGKSTFLEVDDSPSVTVDARQHLGH